MLFNSFGFIIFFPMVLAIYMVIPRKLRACWLLLASYAFYAFWNPAYLALLIASTLLTYASALIVDRYRDNTRIAKASMITCLTLNLGILFVFKYFNFFSESVGNAANALGLTINTPAFSLVLPVGISFYIFQAVGYAIDVYRGTVKAEKNPIIYALFVSFFPQLVAGPIERSKNLLPQFKKLSTAKIFDVARMQSGALTMLYGYILKMVISDRAKIYVDTVFAADTYTLYPGLLMFIGAVLFSIQIYCDFAGYTYIAIGSAKILGFDLMNNFDTPYFAECITDFWSRWHISLTTWFKDYLYIPLGGNRKGKVRKYINIFIVFLLSGLWHGAAWHFVIWGVIHGILRILDELTSKARKGFYGLLGARDNFSFKLYKIAGTFLMTTFAWIFFRAESTHQAMDIIGLIFSKFNPWVLTDGSVFLGGMDAHEFNVLIFALIILIVVSICKYRKVNIAAWFLKQGWIFKSFVFIAGILFVTIYGIYGTGYDAASFIYFQF